ncbi:MAG: DUF5606 domain-containing protein [Raineya sp.]
MELKEIAAISGKEGLYRVLKPARNGVIVETLDAQKKKMAVGAAGKVSILKEISIYTTTKEGSVPLQDVLILMHEKHQGTLPLDSKANTADLMNFIAELLPDFDSEKVYPSDVKKLVKWYGILVAQAPEVLVKQEESPEQTNTETPTAQETEPQKEEQTQVQSEEIAEEKPKRTKAKSTKKEENETKLEETNEEKPKKTRAKSTKKEEVKTEEKVEEATEEKPKKTRAKKQS